LVPKGVDGENIVKVVSAIENGRRLAKDIGGADCERMTPKRVADHVKQAFEGTQIKVVLILFLDFQFFKMNKSI
jgi:hypothetical protein